MESPKILIVDDEREMRWMLRGVLSSAGRVVEASNGLDALCLLQREKPRLMLLDLAMPEMDGLEVLARALQAVPSVHVVVLTGEADMNSAAAALDRGARAYITKPFDPGSLRDEVARLLLPPSKYGGAPWQMR